MAGRVIEVTFTLIVLYLILANAAGFGQVIASASSAYTQAVRTLQGK